MTSPPSKEPKPKQNLLIELKRRPMVFDGAMGTIIYERGHLYTQNFDALSRDKPELIESIHRSYVAAGAEVLETNTFGANSIRLKPHNLEGSVRAINRSAVKVARDAAEGNAWVAGSVGPTGLLFKSLSNADLEVVRSAFAEQLGHLLEEGVDAVLFETFRQLAELQIALDVFHEMTKGAKAPCSIASVSFDAFGTMADGTGPEATAKLLADWGADVIGVNCADGPAGVYEMATRMLEVKLPVVAQPNAGLPHRVDGRFAYLATPEYFLVYGRRMLKAGVRGIGGCCGTTPDHIKQVVAAARMLQAASMSEESGGGMREDVRDSLIPNIAPGTVVTPTSDKGLIGAKLGKDFIVSVEINPPPGLSLDKALTAARILKAGGVDVINVADGARATARMGNHALCVRIQNEIGMPALMHVTTRDRNVLGLVAHLLACHDLGVHNLVVITGDPPKMGDFPDATPVYDIDSIGLLKLVGGLNRGFDPGGKPLGAATKFLCATGAEPAAHDYDRELLRLRKKVEAGAEMVMTQPVYDPAVLERFLGDIKDLNIPVLVGILPLASYRNAEFLHNEVPGMSVPEAIRERMRRAGNGDEGRAEGVSIAREMLSAVKDRVAGAYIMPPFGKAELALAVVQGIVK